MHTYKNCISFLIIQQLFIFILITSYSFLHLLTATYSCLQLLISLTTYIQLLQLLTVSYSPLYFLTAYSCILRSNKTDLIKFSEVIINLDFKFQLHQSQHLSYQRKIILSSYIKLSSPWTTYNTICDQQHERYDHQNCEFY